MIIQKKKTEEEKKIEKKEEDEKEIKEEEEEEEEEVEEEEESDSSSEDIVITLNEFKEPEADPLMNFMNNNMTMNPQQLLLLQAQTLGLDPRLRNLLATVLMNPAAQTLGYPEGGGAKTAFDLEIESMDDHPWRKPGADITDYFNYGFNEQTWKVYQQKQLELQQEQTMQSKIKVYDPRDDAKSDLPPELLASFNENRNHNSNNNNNNHNNFNQDIHDSRTTDPRHFAPEKRRAPDDRNRQPRHRKD